MPHRTISDAKLNQVVKKALVEPLTDRGDLFADVIVEALEDVALGKAIRESEKTEVVSRDDIFEALKGEA